ncbi:MAG: hypothetical protein NTU59_00835, partial [Coprothermobacterota bacterium]|nr:hypothetical protein [Coprothermobacterota bacterium]
DDIARLLLYDFVLQQQESWSNTRTAEGPALFLLFEKVSVPFWCHPEPFASLKGKLRSEGSCLQLLA